MFENLKTMKESMIIRVRETFLNAVQWFPVFLLGMLLFLLATGSVPDGTLADYRIKIAMIFGRSMMAVYFGQILQNLLFPTINEEKLITNDLDEIPAKNYNIMWGRLVLHGIMQFVFNTM